MNGKSKKSRHWFRGVISLLVLGPILLVCSLNLLILVVQNFLSGLNPQNWFSGNGADWLFSYGNTGGASMYFGFMLNGFIAFGCASGISWAFTGSGLKP